MLKNHTSIFNTNDGECFLGSCSILNMSTCLLNEVIPFVSNHTKMLSLDEDGCFNNSMLRSTVDFQQFIQVNIYDIK